MIFHSAWAIRAPENGLPVGGHERFPAGVAMLRHLIAYPGEAGSGLMLFALGIASPMMVEPHLVTIEPHWHWIFSWVGGYCAAAGICQFAAVLLDWRRGRLWMARFAVTAAALLIGAFTTVRFVGVAVSAFCLLFINILSAMRWELRAYDQTGSSG